MNVILGLAYSAIIAVWAVFGLLAFKAGVMLFRDRPPYHSNVICFGVKKVIALHTMHWFTVLAVFSGAVIALQQIIMIFQIVVKM